MSDNDDLNAGPEPLPERLVGDVETLRALSDPLRLRILEIMTARSDETFTVKRLATSSMSIARCVRRGSPRLRRRRTAFSVSSR